MLRFLLVVAVFAFTTNLVNSEDEVEGRPRVSTPLGEVEGHYKQSYGGRRYRAFEGIPYAKPPVGNLRFKEPHKVEPWLGTIKATQVQTCMQAHYMMPLSVTGNEDCLYLNVYIPEDVKESKLDVIVHIHGGAFMMGNSDFGAPGYLIDRDVVYVSINYRLGILGFLSTEDEVVPGNNGMKDQVMALEWVKRNIESFGGNPSSVTIVGTSAGGASVHLHYFSPLSKELFHRGFSQSGTALDPWVIQKDALIKARRIARSVGCDQESTKEFVECVRQKPAHQIVRNTDRLQSWSVFSIAPMAPVVEPNLDGAFLTQHPYEILKEGKVVDLPWLVSTTSDEGIMPGAFLLNKTDEIEERWNELLPYILEYHSDYMSDAEKIEIATKIKEFYFGNEKLSQENFGTFIKLLSHVFFQHGSEKSARMQALANKSPVYYYLYGYLQAKTSFGAMFSSERLGVCHGDDAGLLYEMQMFGTGSRQKLTDEDENVKETLVDIVTSFAKTGKPDLGREWEKVESTNFKYLYFNATGGLEMKSDGDLVPLKFLDSLFFKKFEDSSSLGKQEL